MKLQATRITGRLGGLCFLVLFPGFFFYYSLIALGLVPRLPFGYFGAACAVSLALLAPLRIDRLLRTRTVNRHSILVFLLLLNFSAAVLLGYYFDTGRDLTFWHAQSILQFLACYLVLRSADFSSDRAKKILLFCCAVMGGIVISNIDGGQFYLRLRAGDSVGIPTYQGFAMSLIVTFFVTASAIKTLRARLVIHALAIVLLYLNGARTEFVGYILFFATLEAIHARRKATVAVTAFITCFSAIIFIAFGGGSSGGNRVANLLRLSSDNSFNVRNEIFLAGLNDILSSPLIGAYGSYDPGWYIHNALSAWVDIGILGPILIVAIFISMILKTSRFHNYGNRDVQTHAAVGMIVCSAAILASSAYFMSPIFGAVCGYCSALRLDRFGYQTVR